MMASSEEDTIAAKCPDETAFPLTMRKFYTESSHGRARLQSWRRAVSGLTLVARRAGA
jgi:hypothetical protein